MKVLFIMNVPTPYRVDFFSELGKFCDLTVIFERQIANDRNEEWMPNEYLNFKAIFLKYSIKTGIETAISIDVTKYIHNSYDIIVIGGYGMATGALAIEIARIKRVPFILNADGGLMHAESRLKKCFKRHLISAASAWIASGDKARELFMNYGANSEKIYTYQYATFFEKEIISSIIPATDKKALRKSLGLDHNRLILGVGRFVECKNFETLIRAFASLQRTDIGLVLIGGGPLNNSYKKLIKMFDIKNIHLIPFNKKNDLIKYYDAADLFCLPTKGDVWGLVINEAMSRGLPVITTDKCVAGLELVNDNNGRIVPVEDVIQLGEALSEICKKSDKELMEMGKQSLSTIKAYTIENMALRHKEIFDIYRRS